VDTLLDVAQVLALLSVSALCIYVMVVLARLKDLLAALQQNLAEFNLYAKPVLENLLFITEKFRSIAMTIDEQVSVLKESLESIKAAAENVVAFERRVRQLFEEPIVRLTAALSGVMNRVVSWFGGTPGSRSS
jgi:uncharacterized protein YoxC